MGVAKTAVAFALVVPALALAVPIGDTGWAIVRRRRRRVSIAHPDTRHIHHQLLDFGLSPLETCLLFYGATAILGTFGLMLFGHRRILLAAVVQLLVGLFTVLGDKLQQVGWRMPVPWLSRLLATARGG
jgi:UDP-GlcNAc:undecaprenyl-phosphate GlcNAc-1-phosphate transferase